MNPPAESLMFIAFIVGVVLSLGVLADLFVLVFWPKLKKHFYFPLNEKELKWDLKDVAFFLFFYVALQLVSGLLIMGVSKWDLLSEGVLRYVSLFWSTFGVNLIVFLVLLAYLSKHFKIAWEDLGLKWIRPFQHFGLGLLSYIGFVPIFFGLVLMSALVCSALGIQPQPHVIVMIFQEETSRIVLALLALFASLIGPILEEIFFRGFIYPAAKKRWGVPVGMIVTSLFFAAIHMNAFQFFPILGLGLLLTFLYEATGSLIPSITLHALNNTVSVIFTFSLIRHI